MHAIDSTLQNVRQRKGYLIACNCNADERCWNLNTVNLWLHITTYYVKQGNCKKISDHFNPLMYSILSTDSTLLLLPSKHTPWNFEHRQINVQAFVCWGMNVRQKITDTVNSLLLQFVASLVIQKLLRIYCVLLVVYSSPVSFTPLYQLSPSTLQVWENINSKHCVLRTFLTD